MSLPDRSKPTYNAGAVGIQLTQDTTVRAISSTLGVTCTDSPIQAADFVVVKPPVEAGPLPDVPSITPSGAAATQNNDFQAQITDTTAGATICYTFGTTAPTCTVSASGATCDMGTATYNGPININSATTQVAPGQVEIQAIACNSAGKSPTVAMAQLTLQAAVPTMSPGAGSVPYSAALTGSFQDQTSGATVYYTSDGTTTPTCTPGGAVQTYAAPFALKSGTFKAIACKAGYEPSAVTSALAVSVSAVAPTLSPAAGGLNTPTQVAVTAASMAAEPANTWYCYSASANGATNAAPTCGTTAGTCGTGTTTGPTPTSGQQVQAIACAPSGYSNSTVTTSGPYTLQLSAPYFNPDGTNTTGAALTSYTLTMADGTHPTSLVVTAGPGQAGSWMCVVENPAANAPPACDPAKTGNVKCLVGNANASAIPLTLAGGTTPTLASLTAGTTLAAVMCPDPVTADAAANAGFSASPVVSLVVSGAGQAPAPTISYDTTANNAHTFYQPLNPAILNTSASPMTVCYTTDGTTPTCTVGSTTGGCSSLDGSGVGGTETLNYTVTKAGTGYTVPPYVTIAGGACANASATATIVGGAVTGIVGAGTCTNLAAQPAIALHVGGGLTFTAPAAVAQAIAFTIANSGSGYGANTETVDLSETVGANTLSCTGVVTTSTLGTGNGIKTLAASTVALGNAGCPLFPGTPTVTIKNGGGTGATATAVMTQTVTMPVVNPGGQFYTVAPGIVLTPHAASPGGTCTTYTPVFGALGAITSVTATGCSGFTDTAPTVTVTDPPAVSAANAGAVVAVGSNMQLVSTIQKSATKLSTIACNAGLSKSPVYAETYTFVQPTPLVGFTPTGGNFAAGSR